MNACRLFDCLQHQLDAGGLSNMLSGKYKGEWKHFSTNDVMQIVNQLSIGLMRKGLSANDNSDEGKDKVAILCKNKPEWIFLDMAVQKLGLVLVPVYPTILIDELVYILNEAEVKYLFVNTEAQFKKINPLREKVPALQDIYSFEKFDESIHWEQLLAMDYSEEELNRLNQITSQITPDALATILYTSGTTGLPKGVMLTHKNITSNIFAILPIFPPGNIAMSFLPLNHIFERMVVYGYMFKKLEVHFADVETIVDNLKDVQPALFTTVPRLLEKVFEKILEKGNGLPFFQRMIFNWAVWVAKHYHPERYCFLIELQRKLFDKLVYAKWRAIFGTRLTAIISGGAACSVNLMRIFSAAKILIMEGYGLTETSPVISFNQYDKENRRVGTVGKILSTCKVKIAEDKEILCSGDGVMKGYYKNSTLTNEVIQNGWFHTGDTGEIINNKFLKIVGRKKEIFKTSFGKYVAPVPIEKSLEESLYIEYALVIGANQKFLTALIVPSFNHLKDWCIHHHIEFANIDELLKTEKIKHLYKDIVKECNARLPKSEAIIKFELVTDNWTIESGELTPKMNYKREFIYKKYATLIEKFYS